ncbi:hypothetical protein HCU40_08870 [Pseudanabaena biceps]|nr:hypothetical protein [Pseudanabaena biceps]
MSRTLKTPTYRPYTLNDLRNWQRRVLKEQSKKNASIPYSLGDSIDWKRSCLKEQLKRQTATFMKK